MEVVPLAKPVLIMQIATALLNFMDQEQVHTLGTLVMEAQDKVNMITIRIPITAHTMFVCTLMIKTE